MREISGLYERGKITRAFNYVLTAIILIAMVSCKSSTSTSSTPVYSLTAEVSPPEGGTVNPSNGTFDEGEEVEVRAEPSENWYFVRWEGDHSGTANPSSLKINSDKKVIAVFMLREYPLHIEVNGNGSVTEEVVENASKSDYEHGTTVRLTAEPDEGWEFAGWEGDLTGSENPQTIVVDSQKNVTAVFKLIEYPLEIEIEGEGSVTEEIVNNSAKTDYEHGTTVRLTAEPAEGWEFVRWEGDLTGSENPQTLLVESEKSVKAVFEILEYSLTVSVEGDGEVTADPDKVIYQHGDEITLTTTASDNWRFDEWLGDASGTDPVFTFVITEDTNIMASFVPLENALWSVGYNFNGQIGDGTRDERHVPAWTAYDVEKPTAGSWHSLFVKIDGTLWGTGYNFHGQLGDGSTTDRHSPVQITSGVREAAAGEIHSMFVTENGVLYAMGDNSEGQLGDGTFTSRVNPVQIDTDVQSVAIGEWHSLYVKNDGTLWGTGRNTNNQVSSASEEMISTPVLIDENVVQVVAGQRHTVYLKTDGTMWAFGGNASGQLGDGTNTSRSEPYQVASDVEYVAAGRDHTMFVTSNGNFWATGNNTEGQLGDGTLDSRSSPVLIDTSVSRADGGNRHTMYVKTDGTLWAVGNNNHGQLGDGSTTRQLEPIQIDTEVKEVAVGIYFSQYVRE